MAFRMLALLAGVGLALAGGAAMAAGDCGSYHVKAVAKQAVASADQSSTPMVPAPKGG